MELPVSDSPRLVLLRHGDTAWASEGRHTGRTDVPLTPAGEAEARRAGDRLHGLDPALVLCSPLQRARRTAELAGYPDAVVDADLAEWDYGPVEGRTSAEVGAVLGRPYEIFRDGVAVPGLSVPGLAAPGLSVPGLAAPGLSAPPSSGESLAQVRARAERVLQRVRPVLADGGTVLAVAHGHLLRVLATAWLEVDATFGAHLELGCAAVCALGRSHHLPTIEAWNLVDAG
ncbi:acid phosphatase [Isoptericola chiayiensis]|uniref:Acid phosphatase n=1 Tax=Isoptericola chiayiensis TaxID=579446 RepID=A0ABP8Y8C6_9MICO|nr:histidine phosphatase family protein [Isoptericola chiayiensis]NOW00748.1 putative phosphoglycerate mutase [Isoptericola chiayiensis]